MILNQITINLIKLFSLVIIIIIKSRKSMFRVSSNIVISMLKHVISDIDLIKNYITALTDTGFTKFLIFSLCRINFTDL